MRELSRTQEQRKPTDRRAGKTKAGQTPVQKKSNNTQELMGHNIQFGHQGTRGRSTNYNLSLQLEPNTWQMAEQCDERTAGRNGRHRMTQLPKHNNPPLTAANKENSPSTNKSIWHQVQCWTESTRECRPGGRSQAAIHGTATKDTGSWPTCSGVPMDGCRLLQQRTSFWQSQSHSDTTVEHEEVCTQDANLAERRPCHPQVFFGFMEPPDKIMENIGWWLCSMEQGMWKARLQQAKETTGLGWLLFSADEFDKEALKVRIWEITGVHIALCYQAIDDGIIKRDANNQKRVKAIHIEVGKFSLTMSQNRLKRLYSLAATTFPLGIKMRLVCELWLLTNADAKAKATLRTTQQRFLDNMDSCISWGVSTLDLVDKTMHASLWHSSWQSQT